MRKTRDFRVVGRRRGWDIGAGNPPDERNDEHADRRQFRVKASVRPLENE